MPIRVGVEEAMGGGVEEAKVPLLLCDDDDDDDDDDVDDDTATMIVAQLLISSSNERSGRPCRRRCIEKFFGRGRRRCVGRAASSCSSSLLVALAQIVVPLLSWMGLLASGWSYFFSCDLIDVIYPPGGVRLTVEAVGIWGYQRGGGGGAPGVNPGGGESGGGGGAGAGACVRYGATLAGQPELKDMFPSSRMLQFCSVLAIAFYLVAFLAVVVVFFASVISSSSAHRPGAIDRSYEESAICPPTTTTTGAGMTIVAATAVAAFSFPTSAIMHIVILHGLLHYNDHDGEANNNDQSSPICNPTYSSCYLGPGGRYAVLAIVTAFFCGIVSLLPAYYYVGCNKAGRNARLCCWR